MPHEAVPCRHKACYYCLQTNSNENCKLCSKKVDKWNSLVRWFFKVTYIFSNKRYDQLCSIYLLQSGHTFYLVSHYFTHPSWNLCSQGGKIIIVSSAYNPQKQIVHWSSKFCYNFLKGRFSMTSNRNPLETLPIFSSS
jgi:hypothetical protein